MDERETRAAIQDLFKFVDAVILDLAELGQPLPKENSKSFYLKCCWVLQWLNKFEQYKHDDKVQNVRKNLIGLLPKIKEAGI
jgi:hypothetical protein